jgi:hypothetical protein
MTTTSTIDEDKRYIINLFIKNVKDVAIPEKKHCCSEGHFLEQKMGIPHNSKNEPDIRGYEMKKDAKKITFGDFSAAEYLFSKKKVCIDRYNKQSITISRDNFIRSFGHQNPQKHNRFSWSGKCVPKYGEWNDFGQLIEFDEKNNLCIYYDRQYDKRDDTYRYKPTYENKIMIAYWSYEKLEKHINKKFNKKGFFICKKGNEADTYNTICFGGPFTIDYFIEHLKNKNIIFDSGMYMGNTRNYSVFRSSCEFWNKLITDEYTKEL